AALKDTAASSYRNRPLFSGQSSWHLRHPIRHFGKGGFKTLGDLCQTASQALLKYFQATIGSKLRPGWAAMTWKVYDQELLMAAETSAEYFS
ncbi:MAG: hypothetical protein AB1715_10560, partial [Acidobacteriota bacterium]